MKTKTNETIEERRSALDKDSTSAEKSQVVPKKRRRSYTLAFLLYPDNIDHASALAEVIRRFDYAYILHDKDEKEMDFKEHGLDPDNPNDRELIKKSHYHVITFHPSQKSSFQIAKELQIEPRFVSEVTDRNAMLVYLTHIGDRSKHQYSIDEVVCNRPSIYLEGLQQTLTKTEKLQKVLRIIQNKNCTNIFYALECLAREGLTDFASTHYSMVRDLVNEQYYISNRVSSPDWMHKKCVTYECLPDNFNLDELMKK